MMSVFKTIAELWLEGWARDLVMSGALIAIIVLLAVISRRLKLYWQIRTLPHTLSREIQGAIAPAVEAYAQKRAARVDSTAALTRDEHLARMRKAREGAN